MNGNAIQEWDAPAGERDERRRLVSLFAPAHRLSTVAFARGGRGGERFYWAEPGGAFELAGVGVAAEVRVPPVLDADETAVRPSGYRFAEVERLARGLFAGLLLQPAQPAGEWGLDADWRHHPARPRLFGGFAFQDDFVPDATWSVFSPAHFILPHYQYVRAGQQAYLTISALVGPEERLPEVLAGLREALATRLAAPPAATTRPIDRPNLRYPMTPDMWRDMVARAAGDIRAGKLEKVVLSRVCEVRAAESIDAAATLDFLSRQYGDSYRFLFEPVAHHAFFGATPELLIERCGNRARTMALAGSAPRGHAPEEDEALAAQLLASPKDRREHELVVAAIRDQLAPHAADLTAPPEPTVLRLRNIQHLLTPIEARPADHETGVLPLARRLHPTPAMGGVPAGRALAFLRRAEPVPRGWYAAPIGWVDARQDGVFAVAIRSAVAQHDRAWLYAGAGILGDSQPEREWAETALKFRPMLGALGVAEAM